MKITSISAYVVKSNVRYLPAGQAVIQKRLPGSEYFRLAPYPQLYAGRSEAVVVHVETDEGVTGWGECQAPIAPEVTQTVVEKVLAPVVLGQDPRAVNVRYADMYGTQRVRGQGSGYQLDAMAGVDTALWDIRGKTAGCSIAELLGGRFRDELPCYVTGLRGKSRPERLEEAREWIDKGIGVKAFLGFGVREDAREIEAIRDAVGDDAALYIDGVWRYSLSDALRVGRVYERCGVEFLEAPLAPEDVAGHARIARSLDLAIAIGEPLRTRHQFIPWFEAGALAIAQPDVMRSGITETVKIATLAEAFHVDVALHTGCSTVVGMAATWQTAAALPNFLVQEHQPVMLDTFNHWLAAPLEERAGKLQVPTGPGLGLDVDMARFSADVDSVVTVGLDD